MRGACRPRWGAFGRADHRWSDGGRGHRRRSVRAPAHGGEPSVTSGTTARAGCAGWGERPAHGVEIPAQQIAFSKSMNWALSLPGACLPLVQSAPGRPILTHLPPFTGSMIWSL